MSFLLISSTTFSQLIAEFLNFGVIVINGESTHLSHCDIQRTTVILALSLSNLIDTGWHPTITQLSFFSTNKPMTCLWYPSVLCYNRVFSVLVWGRIAGPAMTVQFNACKWQILLHVLYVNSMALDANCCLLRDTFLFPTESLSLSFSLFFSCFPLARYQPLLLIAKWHGLKSLSPGLMDQCRLPFGRAWVHLCREQFSWIVDQRPVLHVACPLEYDHC